jgi:hypothetical protein
MARPGPGGFPHPSWPADRPQPHRAGIGLTPQPGATAAAFGTGLPALRRRLPPPISVARTAPTPLGHRRWNRRVVQDALSGFFGRVPYGTSVAPPPSMRILLRWWSPGLAELPRLGCSGPELAPVQQQKSLESRFPWDFRTWKQKARRAAVADLNCEQRLC